MAPNSVAHYQFQQPRRTLKGGTTASRIHSWRRVGLLPTISAHDDQSKAAVVDTDDVHDAADAEFDYEVEPDDDFVGADVVAVD